jgi:hypothetical protein
MARPIEIFFSYAHEDKNLMDDVREHLIFFEREGRILKWHDRMIPPGTEWRGQIDRRLRVAQIILLFISRYFFASRYIYDVEMKEALARHKSGKARVIPVILRPCLWEKTPLGDLQVLPTNGRAITKWRNREEACADVAEGIMQVVSELPPRVKTTHPLDT